jgi:predicted O-linked N-acetylglucosamine transferase (SPINDLY family)
VFTGRLTPAEHLARHSVADLFLDTLPYNAHTTCSDALWSHLPVITLVGNTFPGRVSASLLHAIGLPELITNSEEEYEALAIALATDPPRLKAIKQKLKKNCLSSPLFNSQLFTKNIEKAYIKMYERNQQNLPPDHITID